MTRVSGEDRALRAVGLDQRAIGAQLVEARRPHGFRDPLQLRFFLRGVRSVGEPHVESVEGDGVCVDVVRFGEALLDETAERA